MKDSTLNSLADELGRLYKEDVRSFPYEDVRVLRQQARKRWLDLVPDLDLYFSTIAGYCTWGHRILDWPQDKVQEAHAFLRQTFFERHPEYLPLEARINTDDTPALHADLVLHEKMRQTLLTLLDCLSKQHAAQTLQAVA